MKKITKLLLVSFVLLSSQAFAQDTAQQKKNIIKLNLTSLIFKNFSLQYERVLTRKTSVALGVSIMPKTGLPFAKTLKDQFESNGDAARAIDETQLSNMAITPEFRFYLGRKPAPAGFYLAPFARWNRLKFDQFYRFTTSDGTKHVANIKGTIDNIGGGLLLGAQWHLSKTLTLDWWIAGPIVGSTKGTLIGTDPINIQPGDRQKIKDDIEGTDLPGLDVKAVVEQNKITADLSGGYYGLRAFGFALGFKF